MSIFGRRGIRMERFEDRLNDLNLWKLKQIMDREALLKG